MTGLIHLPRFALVSQSRRRGRYLIHRLPGGCRRRTSQRRKCSPGPESIMPVAYDPRQPSELKMKQTPGEFVPSYKAVETLQHRGIQDSKLSTRPAFRCQARAGQSDLLPVGLVPAHPGCIKISCLPTAVGRGNTGPSESCSGRVVSRLRPRKYLARWWPHRNVSIMMTSI